MSLIRWWQLYALEVALALASGVWSWLEVGHEPVRGPVVLMLAAVLWAPLRGLWRRPESLRWLAGGAVLSWLWWLLAAPLVGPPGPCATAYFVWMSAAVKVPLFNSIALVVVAGVRAVRAGPA